MNPPPPAPVPAGPRTQEMTEEQFAELLTIATNAAFACGEWRKTDGDAYGYFANDYSAKKIAVMEAFAAAQSAPSGLAEENRRLREGLEDAIRGLEVAQKALATAGACMDSHEMQDSRWDNPRFAIYTAKIASFATITRTRALLQTSAAPVGTRKEGT